jgi:hypothetical protein
MNLLILHLVTYILDYYLHRNFLGLKQKRNLPHKSKHLFLLLNPTREPLNIFHTMNILNYLIQWSNIFSLMERKYMLLNIRTF